MPRDTGQYQRRLGGIDTRRMDTWGHSVFRRPLVRERASNGAPAVDASKAEPRGRMVIRYTAPAGRWYPVYMRPAFGPDDRRSAPVVLGNPKGQTREMRPRPRWTRVLRNPRATTQLRSY